MTDTIDETGGVEALGGYFEDQPDTVGDSYIDISAENPAARLMEAEAMRMAEALVFASSEPVSEKALAARLPDGVDVHALMEELQEFYDKRGVNLVRIENAWAFRTAGDLGFLMQREEVQQRKLSRAALEVLAIIAYHQPITRAEMEEIRGVETSKGTIDVLMETGWVKMRGRRKTPGRPVTYGTTRDFLDHFGLSEIRDLPGILEGIAEASAHTQNLTGIVEHVRGRLARQLCHANRGPDGALPVITLSPEWEGAFSEALVGQGEERQLALAPSRLHDFVARVRTAFEDAANQGAAPVLLTSPAIRPYVRSLIERFRGQTPVMSQNEIHPKARLRTLGQV